MQSKASMVVPEEKQVIHDGFWRSELFLNFWNFHCPVEVFLRCMRDELFQSNSTY